MRQLSFTSNYSLCMTSFEKPTHKHTDIRTKTNTFSAKNYVVWEYLCKTLFSLSKNVKLKRLRLKKRAKNICFFATALLLLCMLLWQVLIEKILLCDHSYWCDLLFSWLFDETPYGAASECESFLTFFASFGRQRHTGNYIWWSDP